MNRMIVLLALLAPSVAAAEGPVVLGTDVSGFNPNENLGTWFGDIDGDGDVDLTHGSYWGHVWVRQNSNDSWQAGAGGAWGGQFSSYSGLHDADDNPADLETFWIGLGNVRINDGPVTNGGWDTGLAASRIAVGDATGDGRPDIWLDVNGQAPRLAAWQAFSGTPSYGVVWTGSSAVANMSHNPQFVDLDGDGDLDVAQCTNNGPLKTWLNNGDGTFVEGWQSPTHNNGVVRMVPADADGDGDQDLLVYDNQVAERFAMWVNDGTGTLVREPIDLGVSPNNPWMSAADWDGDGDDELLTAPVGNGPTRVYDFDGSVWTAVWTGPVFSGKNTGDVDFVDMDGDGQLEIAESNSGRLRIFGADSDRDGVPDYADACDGGDDQADADGDGVPDDCDVCPGTAGQGDGDGDGVPDCADTCPSDPDTTDTDGDGVHDCGDVCQGDDATGDTDTDGVCDDVDQCPGDNRLDDDNDGVPDACDSCAGDDRLDADFDGVPDACDLCVGDDATGDDDVDGSCNDIDACLGDDATGDGDFDGVCDDVDLCLGNDGAGDSDGDAVCDDRDTCTGDDATGDADVDGVCDDIDQCAGDDASGDADSDGRCDDSDACFGDDSTGDADADGRCDDVDACVGTDASGDTDSDGTCDDQDLCVGDDASGDTDADGTCNDTDPVVVAMDDAFDTTEDTALTVDAASGLLANDLGVELTATLGDEPASGVVVIQADGSFEYTPDLDFVGRDRFTYLASDADDVSEGIAIVEVGNGSDAPIAVSDGPYEVRSDAELVVAAGQGLLANDIDQDGDALTVTGVTEEPLLGTVTVAGDGSFTYVPNEASDGIDSFTYEVSDGETPVTGRARIFVTFAEPTEVDDTADGFYPDGAVCQCSSTSGGGLPMLALAAGLLVLRRREDA